jgi:hypothetical protein
MSKGSSGGRDGTGEERRARSAAALRENLRRRNGPARPRPEGEHRLMEIGINLATESHSWKVVQRAEELGFSYAWFYDTQMLSADVFVAMAAAAMRTSKIKLATGGKIRFLNPEIDLINTTDPIPLHISALGPKGRKLTAKLGAGWLFTVRDVARSAAALTDMNAAWREAGRPDWPRRLNSALSGMRCRRSSARRSSSTRRSTATTGRRTPSTCPTTAATSCSCGRRSRRS